VYFFFLFVLFVLIVLIILFVYIYRKYHLCGTFGGSGNEAVCLNINNGVVGGIITITAISIITIIITIIFCYCCFCCCYLFNYICVCAFIKDVFL
jgi:hypothetical protein